MRDHRSAATHIQSIVGDHLGSNTSERAVARWLGMKSQQWSRYLNGQTSPSESQINRWLRKCWRRGVSVPPSVWIALANPTVWPAVDPESQAPKPPPTDPAPNPAKQARQAGSPAMSVVSTTELRKGLSSTIKRVCYGREHVGVAVRGEVLAVIIPVKDYDALRSKGG